MGVPNFGKVSKAQKIFVILFVEKKHKKVANHRKKFQCAMHFELKAQKLFSIFA